MIEPTAVVAAAKHREVANAARHLLIALGSLELADQVNSPAAGHVKAVLRALKAEETSDAWPRLT